MSRPTPHWNQGSPWGARYIMVTRGTSGNRRIMNSGSISRFDCSSDQIFWNWVPLPALRLRHCTIDGAIIARGRIRPRRATVPYKKSVHPAPHFQKTPTSFLDDIGPVREGGCIMPAQHSARGRTRSRLTAGRYSRSTVSICISV
jgi:hypothetical protein